jgi:hypothetical protein
MPFFLCVLCTTNIWFVRGTRRFHDLDVMHDAESVGRYAPSTLVHPRFGGLAAAAKLYRRLRRLCP